MCAAIVSLAACRNSAPNGQQIPPNAIPIVYTSYIFVQGTVDGHSCNILLDTGADNLYLDSIFYARNNLSYTKTHLEKITGIGNSYQKILVVDDSVNFTFGHNSYTTSDVVVLMLKPTGGDYIDGLLGTSYFMQNVLKIDYFNQYIENHSSIDSVCLDGYSSIPMQIVGHSPMVELNIKINDTLTMKSSFMVDIGSPTTTISSSFVSKLNLDKQIDRKARYYTKYGGIGGDSAGYDFISDSVSLAGFILQNATISYSIDTAGIFFEDDFGGILGGNILDRFDLVFDFINSKLHLKPNATFCKPFIYDRLGFYFNDRTSTLGGWIVSSLTEKSEAEKNGLQIDDLIVKVNGVSTDEIPYIKQKHHFDDMKNVSLEVVRHDSLVTICFDLIPLL